MQNLLRKKYKLLAIAAMFSAGAGLAHAGGVRVEEGEHLKPSGKGYGEVDPSGETKAGQASGFSHVQAGIFYHGGPVMTAPQRVHYIWYGNWGAATATTRNILTNLVTGMSNSPYYRINLTYDNAAHVPVSPLLSVSPQVFNPGNQGFALTINGVFNAVVGAIGAGAPDPNGIYLVMGDPNTNETSGLCTRFCGYHSWGTVKGVNVKFGFIGNTARCPSACAVQNPGPHGNLQGDGMSNITAHEIEEASTDPNLNAWFDASGAENADKCAWTFGATTGVVPNVSNVTFGGQRYLIQRNWKNVSPGFCAMQ